MRTRNFRATFSGPFLSFELEKKETEPRMYRERNEVFEQFFSLSRCVSDTQVDHQQAFASFTRRQMRPNLAGLSLSGGRRCASTERLYGGMDVEDSIRFEKAVTDFINELNIHGAGNLRKLSSTTSSSTSSSSSLAGKASSAHTEARETVRKVVRFADAHGLELATIRYFNIADDTLQPLDSKEFQRLTPIVYVSASPEGKPSAGPASGPLIATFQMPRFLGDFRRKLEQQKVLLESASAFNNSISGTIAVMEMGSMHKSVFVRATYNDWLTFVDHPSYYISDSYDGQTSRFSFNIYITAIGSHPPISGLQFAICYRTAGQEFWDNHHGHNYRFLVPFAPDLHVQVPRARRA